MKLPTFLIAGERRCGTTSLYYWMKAHPYIFLHSVTDMNYFISDEITKRRSWREGELDPNEWEQTHDKKSYAKLFENAEGYRAAGHKGADLLFWTLAHPRIARYLPDARFIVTLRNPVTRAWSHYWNEVGKGREKLSFRKAVEAEKKRSEKSWYARLHLSYIERGFYRKSLEDFYSHIDPSRVLVLISEQNFARPKQTLQKIYKFIGVDDSVGFENAGISANENWTTVPREWAQTATVRPIAKLYNRVSEGVIVRTTKEAESRRKLRKYMQSVFRRPASKIKMSGEIREYLTKLYAPHIESLESFLGYEIPEWKK